MPPVLQHARKKQKTVRVFTTDQTLIIRVVGLQTCAIRISTFSILKFQNNLRIILVVICCPARQLVIGRSQREPLRKSSRKICARQAPYAPDAQNSPFKFYQKFKGTITALRYLKWDLWTCAVLCFGCQLSCFHAMQHDPTERCSRCSRCVPATKAIVVVELIACAIAGRAFKSSYEWRLLIVGVSVISAGYMLP